LNPSRPWHKGNDKRRTKEHNFVENHINITEIPNVKSIPIAISEIENTYS
jgi:hypothetical protein